MSAGEVIADALARDSFGMCTASAIERQTAAVIRALELCGYVIVKADISSPSGFALVTQEEPK